jgi:predicted TPR repeat methyltransferase
MSPRDIGLFLRSARTDAAIARLRPRFGTAGALQAVYVEHGDPWASADPRYRYQTGKYDTLVSLLPVGRRFSHALDLGCGLGLLSRRLAERADAVLGLDLAPAAVEAARVGAADCQTVRFEHGDLLTLPHALDGRFDLVVLADVLYYLAPFNDAVLEAVAERVAALLAPGGLCLLANHYFFVADPDSRRSLRIRDAFAHSPRWHRVADHRRLFYLVSLLTLAA